LEGGPVATALPIFYAVEQLTPVCVAPTFRQASGLISKRPPEGMRIMQEL